MQEVIEVNLTKLLKLNLNVNEYLTLIKIKSIIDEEPFPFISNQTFLDSLISKEFIKINEGGISITEKGKKVFNTTLVIIPKKDFEDFYLKYPMKTPNGRRLRASIKSGDSYTKDFETCYKKYSSVVKSLDEHEAIIKAVETLLYDYKRRGSIDFLQNMETFINQRTWEKYMDSTPLDLYSENVERL